MKNQLQTAITQRDLALQVALSFVGHRISSSDGSYDLLKECVYDAIREAWTEGQKEENEACATIADNMSGVESTGGDIGDAIRARLQGK